VNFPENFLTFDTKPQVIKSKLRCEVDVEIATEKKNARGTNIFHRISISTQFCYYFFANKSQFLKKKIDSEIAMM